MTTQQKLEIFAKKTRTKIEHQRREIAMEIQKTIKTALNEAESEARREMADILREEGFKLQQESNKKIHAAAIEARQEFATFRSQLEDELISDLKRDLQGNDEASQRLKELQDDRGSIWDKWPGANSY